MRVRVVPRHGTSEEGEQVYRCLFSDLKGKLMDGGPDGPCLVYRWTKSVQRVGIRTDAGKVWHFTVPREVVDL